MSRTLVGTLAMCAAAASMAVAVAGEGLTAAETPPCGCDCACEEKPHTPLVLSRPVSADHFVYAPDYGVLVVRSGDRRWVLDGEYCEGALSADGTKLVAAPPGPELHFFDLGPDGPVRRDAVAVVKPTLASFKSATNLTWVGPDHILADRVPGWALVEFGQAEVSPAPEALFPTGSTDIADSGTLLVRHGELGVLPSGWEAARATLSHDGSVVCLSREWDDEDRVPALPRLEEEDYIVCHDLPVADLPELLPGFDGPPDWETGLPAGWNDRPNLASPWTPSGSSRCHHDLEFKESLPASPARVDAFAYLHVGDIAVVHTPDGTWPLPGRHCSAVLSADATQVAALSANCSDLHVYDVTASGLGRRTVVPGLGVRKGDYCDTEELMWVGPSHLLTNREGETWRWISLKDKRVRDLVGNPEPHALWFADVAESGKTLWFDVDSGGFRTGTLGTPGSVVEFPARQDRDTTHAVHARGPSLLVGNYGEPELYVVTPKGDRVPAGRRPDGWKRAFYAFTTDGLGYCMSRLDQYVGQPETFPVITKPTEIICRALPTPLVGGEGFEGRPNWTDGPPTSFPAPASSPPPTQPLRPGP